MIIETALGMQNVNEIASYEEDWNLCTLELQIIRHLLKPKQLLLGDPIQIIMCSPISTVINLEKNIGVIWASCCIQDGDCSKANGLRPIDGPFGDFNDPDGYKAQANRSATLGCEGKWAIHPSQIDLANEVMSPSDKEVNRQRILEAMEVAKGKVQFP